MISNECVACGACKSICPKGCIEMVYNKEGFLAPRVDETKCIHCDACKNVCPMLTDYHPDKDMLSAYLFVNEHDYYRNLSNSGGFFKAVSDMVLEEGGVVFGAYLSDDFMVCHGYVEKKEDMFRLMGSKYVQSDMGDSFRLAKQFLEDGRQVLFSGTPCHIGGLRTYLGKKYENLLTVDLFCAGIPSQVSWKSYLEDYFKEEEIRYVQFNYKGQGWWQSGLRIQFAKNDYYHTKRSKKDPYMAVFLNAIALNSPCYHCKFKGEKRNADFSIGDAWNINRIKTNMDDDRGITVALVNTEKGQKIIQQLSNSHHCFEISLEDAMYTRITWNPDVKVPSVRESFIKDLMDKGFRYSYEKNIADKG